jgi:hypothetical protein
MNEDHPTAAATRGSEPDTRLAWGKAIGIAFAACALFWLILWAAWVELP